MPLSRLLMLEKLVPQYSVLEEFTKKAKKGFASFTYNINSTGHIAVQTSGTRNGKDGPITIETDHLINPDTGKADYFTKRVTGPKFESYRLYSPGLDWRQQVLPLGRHGKSQVSDIRVKTPISHPKIPVSIQNGGRLREEITFKGLLAFLGIADSRKVTKTHQNLIGSIQHRVQTTYKSSGGLMGLLGVQVVTDIKEAKQPKKLKLRLINNRISRYKPLSLHRFGDG